MEGARVCCSKGKNKIALCFFDLYKGIKSKDGPSEKIVTQTFDHPNILHALFNHRFAAEDKTGMLDMIYMIFPYYGHGDLMDYRSKVLESKKRIDF